MNTANPKNNREFKYIRLLAMIYITFLMAATIMAYKIVDISGISEPGSTLIYTFTFFLGNVYAELYGKNYANKLIWESIFCGYIFAFLITFINGLPSPEIWDKYDKYEHVVGHIIRFTNAGVIGFLISSYLNTHLITKWKYKLKGKFFWVRSLAATSISEGVATFCAGLITFFGMLPISDIFHIMTNAFLFKLGYGLIAVWPATFLAYILKKTEAEVANLNSVQLMINEG
ncbi:MAG: queuosine precursor transporter [Tatlockia sp.]|nr:queuosine precursor transporter [Tatlockia sp.]